MRRYEIIDSTEEDRFIARELSEGDFVFYSDVAELERERDALVVLLLEARTRICALLTSEENECQDLHDIASCEECREPSCTVRYERDIISRIDAKLKEVK